MLYLSELFAKKRLVPTKLMAYGFEAANGLYVYSSVLPDSRFILTVTAGENGEISAVVTDPLFGGEYTLHLSPNANGPFVGKVRSEYENALLDIANKCTEYEVFRCANTEAVISRIAEKYGDSPEYLWEKSPESAVFRIPESQKWYAVLMRVSGKTLGLPTDTALDILNLKSEPDKLSLLVDCVKYFPAYHMNKRHWYTVPLEGYVPLSEICERIDISRNIVRSKK